MKSRSPSTVILALLMVVALPVGIFQAAVKLSDHEQRTWEQRIRSDLQNKGTPANFSVSLAWRSCAVLWVEDDLGAKFYSVTKGAGGSFEYHLLTPLYADEDAVGSQDACREASQNTPATSDLK